MPPRKRSKLVQVQAMVPRLTKVDLSERANASHRSLSSFIAGILYEWLQQTEAKETERMVKEHGNEEKAAG